MSDERPVTLVKRRKQLRHKQTHGHRQRFHMPQKICIIHYQNHSEKRIRPLNERNKVQILRCRALRLETQIEHPQHATVLKNFPESLDVSTHGFHRKCYQIFTNLKGVRKRTHPDNDSTDTSDRPSSSKRSRLPETKRPSVLFPPDICIICDKKHKRNRRSTRYEPLVKCLEKNAEQSIKQAAFQTRNTELMARVQDMDLRAREAFYHESCRRYLLRQASKKEKGKTIQDEPVETGKKEAYTDGFKYLCDYIEGKIIGSCQVERMSMLRETFLAYMQENHPSYYNPDYSIQSLKRKLISQFGTRIQFWAPNYKSELVYSSHVQTGQAVEGAFVEAASEERRLEEAAHILRRCIRTSQRAAGDCPWPPPPSHLQQSPVPNILLSFIRILLSGKKIASERKEIISSSIAQDICYSVTNGEWKMPKHVALGTAVRHITGSAELVSLLNHFGHCISHSCLLEIETAICQTVFFSESLLPRTVSKENNVVTHFCWDNFDLLEETATGAGTTHSAHGIVIQEVEPHADPAPDTDIDSYFEPVTEQKRRSADFQFQEPPPCFAKSKAEPVMNIQKTTIAVPDVLRDAIMSDFLWILARHQSCHDQHIPGWSGWMSLMGNDLETVKPQSTVDYMAPVFHPITENSTVQHILQVSMKATAELQQPYTIVTFDLAVAKKAYALVWQDPRFHNIIVRIGVFHLISSYLGAVGKLMTGSGFEDLILQSEICASGSLFGIMSGKHYNRALRVHKVVLEALERLLLEEFLRESKEARRIHKKLSRVLEDPDRDSLKDMVHEESMICLHNRYEAFKQKVLAGDKGKTAQFWLRYAQKIWLVLQLLRATKENNLDLHLACLQEMSPLFFAMDHQNYARFAVVYFLTMLNLEFSHPGAENLFRNGGLSVSRSLVPGCRNPVDQTIEQTINRHAKTKGGVVGFSRRPFAYFRWCVTRHVRTSYLQAAYQMAGMADAEISVHKDMSMSQKQQSEDQVQRMLQAFQNFSNPFKIEGQALFCLSSGVPAPKDIESDILSVDTVGTLKRDMFIKERFQEKTVTFNAPIKRTKLKTFSSLQKKIKITSSAQKTLEIAAQRNLFVQLLILSQDHCISLEKVMQYPLSPIPWALATADGMPTKTDKAKLMHLLEKEMAIENPRYEACSAVIDGMAVLQSLVGLPETFGDLADKVFALLPASARVDFVTDRYQNSSIKSTERMRRGQSDTFLLKGPSTKVPRDWKSFLANGENKENLTELLLSEWKKDRFAKRLKGREVLITTGTKCTKLSSTDGSSVKSSTVAELESTQEEADTRIVLHCFHLAEAAQTDIIVRSPDTDVFLLLLHYSFSILNKVFLDTGTGDRRRIIPITALAETYGPQYCEALVGLHSFTGCDSTSSFVRKGKRTAVNILHKYPQFQATFCSLGVTDLSSDSRDDVQRFVCCLYGRPKVRDVDQLRADLIRERFESRTGPVLDSCSGVDLSLLPPCHSALMMHMERANYQAQVWKSAHLSKPDFPGPAGRGWKIGPENALEIEWCQGSIMPEELIDILCEAPQRLEEHDDDTEIELVNLCDDVQEDACCDF